MMYHTWLFDDTTTIGGFLTEWRRVAIGRGKVIVIPLSS